MRSSMRIVIALTALILGVVSPAGAQLDPLGSGQLLIQGNRLTIYADELTTDAEQTINVAEPARVRTCFGGPEIPCGSIRAGDPRIAGLKVLAELRGPELPQAVPAETVPGGTFVLPPFQQEGDYFLENVRLVSTATGQTLGFAEPSVAVLHVRRIVLASATVRQLSLADLQARGITLTEENFQAFNFAVGFAFEGEIVEIEFPVLFEGNGTVSPLERPRVALDDLPPDVANTVRRWQPPHVIPFRLEVPEREYLKIKAEEPELLTFPLYGAIVIPGTVTFLNQFFEAQLIVANGAPVGSGANLENLHGAIRLPNGNVLRLAATDPPVAQGQLVPVAKADGSRLIQPGEQGTAAWTVEGLVAGTHTLQIDITGDITRAGREPFPVLSRAQAAVEVVDARFNLTFSHPDVVREGEAYSLFVTVTNLSLATQNLITVEIRDQYLTGAHKEDPTDDMRRTIETLEPGQAETVEYRLVADLTGKVVATTFQADSAAGQGTILLRAGVGELGIPLSPATLVMPRFSELLADDLLRANVRLLGLAYSLAVAPAGKTPAGLPRVVTADVERRAVDLAEAGQRLFLQEQLLESLEVLALDQLGNRQHLAEYDELRRRLTKGLRAAEQLAAMFRAEQASRGLDALELLDHFAETTSYARPYLAAMVVPAGAEPAPELEVRRLTEEGLGVATVTADEEAAAVRTLPWGEVYAVRRTAAGADTVPFALVGHLEGGEEFDLVLRNASAESNSGRLVVVVPDGASGDYRRIDLGEITVPALSAVAVKVGAAVPDPTSGSFFDPDSGLPLAGLPAPSRTFVPLPPFRLIGAVQDFRMAEEGPDAQGNMIRPNRYGNGVSYLFNRPPDVTAAETAASYRIRSTFDGLDTAGLPFLRVSEKVGTAAFYQTNSERVVNVRYSTPFSALVDVDGTPLLDHEHLLDAAALVDQRGNPLSGPVPQPLIETVPLHVGGLVDGRVLRGTGEAVEGAEVTLIRPRLVQTATGFKVVLDVTGTTTTDADGLFYFDYIENPNWDKQVLRNFILRAKVPEGADPELEPAAEQEISSFIRLQNRLAHVNIALLGRGAITGSLVYLDDQQPVEEGSVTATSTLFPETRTVNVETDGTFRIGGLPVGPITLTGRDRDGRRVYATVGIEEPGDVVDVRLEIQRTGGLPGLGSVQGKVLRKPFGDPAAEPSAVPGARVTVYSGGRAVASQETDEYGNFLFEEVPEGQVSLQAADFRISRTPTFTDLILAAGETVEVELLLPDSETRTVSGAVEFLDPLTNTLVPIAGAVAFIEGPGVFAYTGADGRYVIEGVPVQGLSDASYSVTAIDFERKLQGAVGLPPVLDTSPDEILAQSIVLREMQGGVDGVVLDPFGRPIGGAGVVLRPFAETTTAADGSFSFDGVPVGTWAAVAHVGDGLTAGRVGYFGKAEARIVFGGHRPFVTVRMRGSGVVNIHTRTATATGILTPIYYRPTYFSGAAKDVTLRGQFIETTTDPNGMLQLVLPVGRFELTAYNPFHGIKEIKSEIEFQGQVKDLDIVFEDAAIVKGQVVDVDGITPVADIPVTLHTRTLLPQTQYTDAQGNYQFELVPKGRLSVTAAGLVGTVERVGRADGIVTLGGQVLEITVQMKAQGTVRGQVMEQIGSDLVPLSHAQYFVQENSYPYRRLPAVKDTFFTTDAEGRYEVSHLYAGSVTVVARDGFQVTRRGQARGEITADWQVVDMPDIVMSTSVGAISVVVRDQESGGPVPDAQVRLSNGEVTVADAEGRVFFDALRLGTYSVYAFYAPTGQSGRVGGLRLTAAGQQLNVTVFLDQRGEIGGTLFDDDTLSVPVAGGTVKLFGSTTSGTLSALATTSGAADALGEFLFQGIPEGSFTLTAAVPGSPRRASAVVALTETAPIAVINMVLEPVADVHVRLYEKLVAGTLPLDLASGIFSLRATQPSQSSSRGFSYDFTRLAPEPGSDVFFYPDVLAERSLTLSAQELGGEQRAKGVTLFDIFASGGPLAGDGSFADPFQLVLNPKGTARVTVRDAGGALVAGANVTLRSSGGGGSFPSVTGADGTVVFTAVPAGNLTATSTSPITGFGGLDTGTLTFDDEVAELAITLAPSVSAAGVVYAPLPDDRFSGDPAELVPAAGAIVEIRDAAGNQQLATTAADGSYRFDVLAVGSFTLSARNVNGDQLANLAGALSGPDGNLNVLPSVILDASPPRILSIVPPPGLEGVSRLAAVEIVFSEPLAASSLPSAQPTFFQLRSASGALAAGAWSAFLDAENRQVVRFEPSQPYDNLTFYSLTIRGGSGGVRDRVGRQLTEFGNVGSNFKTSDTIGPAVIATVPSLDAPIDPFDSIRVDFNEAVVATGEQLDGDGLGDAAELYGEGDNGFVALPVTLFLTRSNFSLQVAPVLGIEIQGDTLRRRLVVSGLTDVHGNPMPTFEKVFRVFDESAPVLVDVPFPDEAPDGQLSQGVAYTLTPVLSNLDDVTPETPDGDLDRVEYFFADPTDPTNPQTPKFAAVEPPFSYSFIAAYSGNGVDPRPFPVYVRAVDTSTNESNVVLVDMQVLPNMAPAVSTVTVEALAPVAGVFYAGSAIRATVAGLDDADGNQLTLSAELWQDGTAEPLAAVPGREIDRPAGGWADAVPELFDFTIPIDLPETTSLFVLGRVIDSQGAEATAESDRFVVADDQNPPQVDSLTARRSGGGADLLFFIGESLVVEFRARDVETAVASVEVTVDRTDIFPDPLIVTLVAGTDDLYRSNTVSVPPDVFTDATPVVFTARAVDFGANAGERTLTVEVAPEPDPTAPTAEWLTPWQGAPWPAGYTSVTAPTAGVPLLLRAEIQDTNLDAGGNEVPGTIVAVTFRGPVVGAGGAIELAADWTAAELVAGTGGPGTGVYQVLWSVPNQVAVGSELPFAVRAVDSGGLDVVRTVTMTPVAPRKVYENVLTAVPEGDAMLAADGDSNGPVFLVAGSTLSVFPQSDGSLRQVAGVVLYAGGEIDGGGQLVVRPTVLTAPEITSYSSAILYYPLELAVTDLFAVSAASRVDMSERGLLGSTETESMVLPGETGAEPGAGGSHGGSGWFGSPNVGWNRTDLSRPGSVYDSLRDPRLPGGGGASFSSTPGGAGGGVVRILAGGATVRLVGEVLARGGQGSIGGGAGGTIRIVADRLEGAGSLDASGGVGTGSTASIGGGGGGGRIAVTYRELGPEVDLAAKTRAVGGYNRPSGAASVAGAGTVYLEALDPITGEASGVLLSANPSTLLNVAITPLPALGNGAVFDIDPTAATVILDVPRVRGDLTGDRLVLELDTGDPLGVFPITAQAVAGGRVELTVEADEATLADLRSQLLVGPVLFHGRTRLAAVEATGDARLVFDDDLEIGAAGDPAPALNDRTRVSLDGEARVMLRGEGPVISTDPTPADGSDVRLGSEIRLGWTAGDPVGFFTAVDDWSLDPGPTTRVFPFGQTEIRSTSVTLRLPVPVDTAPGPVTYTIATTDFAGRSATEVVTWNVLENALPRGSVAMAGGAPATIKAGQSASVVVHAEDPEGLAEVTLNAGGPVNEPSQTAATSGTVQDLVFTLSVPAGATGDVPVIVEAVITDIVGTSVTTAQLVIAVEPNDAPTGFVALAAGASAAIKPGESTTVVVHAEDPDGLSSIELTAAGPVTEPVQTVTVSGTVEDVTFTLTARGDATPGPLPVTAVITDAAGLAAETAPLELAVIENALPTGTVAFAAGTPASVFPGEMVTVEVHAEDEEDLAQIVLVATGPVTAPSQSQTVSGTVADVTFDLTLERTALASETVDVRAEILDAFGNPATVTDSITLGVLADTQAPQVTVTGVAPSYAAGQILTATIETSDEVGASRLDITFDGTTETVNDPGPSYVHTIEVDRTITAPRSTAFEVTATDFHGNTSDPVQIPVDLVPDEPPVVQIDVPSGTDLLPGATIDVAVTASDDVAVATVTFTLSGADSDVSVRQVDAASAFEIYRRTLPVDLLGGEPLQLDVDVTDSFGHTVSNTVPFTVLPDVTPPSVEIELSPEADPYFSGDAVTVIARASDDVIVTDLSLTVAGDTVTGPSPLVYEWTVPIVAGPGTFDITAEAFDPTGNRGEAARVANVEPLVNPEIPSVRFDCPTTGAYLPSGDQVTLQVTATDDLGVARVEFFRDDETLPFATVTPDFGTEPTFVATTTAQLPVVAGEEIVRYRAVAFDASNNGGAAEIEVHVVATVDLDAAGGNDWAALETQFAVLRSGTLTVDEPRTLAGLIVLPGASITHSASAPGAENAVDLTVGGAVYVACGASIDVTGRGYAAGVTYPGATPPTSGEGGSHVGRGGRNGAAQGSTFGSVYRPQEAGGGGQSSSGGRGGGTVRLEASRLVVDGAVRADGINTSRGGAGGSLWISVAGEVGGAGALSARGGTGSFGNGSGGGGAVAVEYLATSGALLANADAAGGGVAPRGGAGTVYLRGPEADYGDLVVNNPAGLGNWTELPALGVGEAQPGSGGTLLVTDLTAIAPYSTGHWVEIYDGASGAFEGFARVESIAGANLTLTPRAGETVAVDPGDLWQGVHVFDNVTLSGGVLLDSEDPIRVLGTFEIDGQAVMRRITAGDLTLRQSASLSHPTTVTSTAPEQLEIELTGDLVIEPEAAIDASGRGFANNVTYPGALAPSSGAGGSHLGRGGASSGSTYGSVYRPRESGGGGGSSSGQRGGGVVRITAASVTLTDATSAIRANAVSGSRGGAGGSVWISTGTFAGDGVVEARGGSGSFGNGSGGGGAIAVEYTATAGTALDNLRAWGGGSNPEGGAGTIYLFGPTSIFGDLVVDNGAVAGAFTELPALGSGVAQAGSDGVTLVTDRAADIPAYFAGHWVEIRTGATGALEGTFRVAAVDGKTATLEPGGGETIQVDAGDRWQGVYRFDNYRLRGSVPVTSADPVRVSGIQEISGDVTAREIIADGLIIREGAVLRHPATVDPAAPESLRIELAGSLVIEPGGAIDVSGRGLANNTTYPGATPPASGAGGAHLGRGGNASGSTFGSVYRPQEPGGGGGSSSGQRGGGIVRIEAAGGVTLTDATSAIRANGSSGSRGGAGGSVWITTTTFAGDGVVEARGGNGSFGNGSAGGGAIAVEYTAASGTAIDNLRAWGGEVNPDGGAGTVHLFGPTATYGDLVVDGGTAAGNRTVLPALGGGVAQAGSGGALLVTDRAAAIPAYFVGHWVEIRSADGTLEGTFRVAAVDGVSATLETGASVEAGDLWQGVYRFDNFVSDGTVAVDSADPIRLSGTQEIRGLAELRQIDGTHLTVRSGGTLTHPFTPGASSPESLTIELTGDLLIEPGGAIDVSGRGFANGTTYPDATPPASGAGGSHLGLGGNTSGSTFGSVYRPQEPGGGGGSSSGQRGGGAVRITAANVTLTDATSAIRANGASGSRGGAGGSVWIVTGGFAGDGVIEARGGTGSFGNGSAGGGAIAVEYTAGSGTVLDNLRTWGGGSSPVGGAGTVHLFGPTALYGDLVVDGGTVAGNRTVLPALGGGVAQAGSGGATLVTDRATDIPAYFAGHWVEIRSPDGTLEGTFRVAAVAGVSATLEAGTGDTISVEAGDLWQGVYRFDNFVGDGTVAVDSADPIRLSGTQEIRGFVELRQVDGAHLTVRSGGTLTHPFTPADTSPESLVIKLSGDLVIEPGGAIDVSGRGFAASTTWPGATPPASGAGGSHLGLGAGNSGSTFGSVYRPQEPGGGGGSSSGQRGGGAVRITAASVTLTDATSLIRATGASGSRGGAGGSVWIATGALAGDGVVEARGGSGTFGNGSGGGGAIAVEYTSAAGTVLDNLRAWGGSANPVGGAGTIHLFGPAAVYGDLVVDGGPVVGNRTVLPALGGGVAQAGSGGALLVTDRATDIPAYFAGHWVEIRSPDGTLEGSFRVAAVDGVNAALEAGAGVDAGDLWQGVYRFDNFVGDGTVAVDSADPIRLSGTQEVRGFVELREVNGANLTVRSGGTLTHPLTPSATSLESLTIELSGNLVIEPGGAIDVTGRGFAGGTTWPGATPPASGSGGSHLGRGGGSSGSTYGSVHRPQEPGGGGGSSSGQRGGGHVRIQAAGVTLVDLTSTIRANGSGSGRGGAGGSVWINTGSIAGDGVIEARGGSGTFGNGSGGGGAIAIDYSTSSGTVLDNLRAWGGTSNPAGGAGTVYTESPVYFLGILEVDNNGITAQNTELPSLGGGVAQAGTGGALLVTDRAVDIPAYFVGHWVEMRDSGGVFKGLFRIAGASGVTATLVPEGTTSPIGEGDSWQGLYRFNLLFVSGGATLVSVDPIEEVSPELRTPDLKSVADNVQGPRMDPQEISVAVGKVGGSYRVDVAAGAVDDDDGIAELRLSDGRSWMVGSWSEGQGTSFLWPGAPGQRLTLTAIDAHPVLRRGKQLRLPPLPDGGWTPPRFALPEGERARHALAGEDWVALADRTVRIFDRASGELLSEVLPPVDGERVIGLAAGNGYLVAARSRRLEIVDLAGADDGFRELPLAAGETLVDLVADDHEAVALVELRGDEGNDLRLASVPLTSDLAASELSEKSALVLPAELFSRWRLRGLEGSLHVIGSGGDGETPDAVFSLPRAQVLAAEPEIRALDDGWRVEGSWQRGLVLASGATARLFELDGRWRETARLDLGGEIVATAGHGERLAFVLPGEVKVFDVSDPAAPRAMAHVVGSAHRDLRMTTETLLFSPGFVATPVVLEMEEWPAEWPGKNGFEPAVDGRGVKIDE